MPLFHTKLFSNDPPGDAFVSRGAAWSFEKDSGVYQGAPDKIHDYSFELFKRRARSVTQNYVSDDVPVFFDMEIMIRARGLAQAQNAMNLLVSAIAVLEGAITFSPEPFSIEPFPVGTTSYSKSFLSKTGLLEACELANRVSRARSLSYALHKLALSYQCSSPHIMDLHPGQSPRRFGVQTDTIAHVYLANAVTLAYSAIEELGLEIRASQKNPSKMPDGTWNPSVKGDVEARLRKSGINISNTAIWTLRGPKTRIEKLRPPPSAGKPSWSRGSVRDVNVWLIDALALASWLRSSTSTHRFSNIEREKSRVEQSNGRIDYQQSIMALKEKFPRVPPEYFDALSNIQQLASDKVHEGSWEAWSASRLKGLLELTKNVLYEMYVVPKQQAERASVATKMLGELRKSKGDDKSGP